MQAAGSNPSPEVVAPLCNTVGLVYAHRAKGHDGLQRLQEGPAVQALRGNVEQPQASSLHRGQAALQVKRTTGIGCTSIVVQVLSAKGKVEVEMQHSGQCSK